MPRRGLRGGPDVDATVGVGPGVRKPGLGDQAGKVREGGGHGLGEPAVVLSAHALETEVDYLDMHHFYSFRYGSFAPSMPMLGFFVPSTSSRFAAADPPPGF